MPSKSLVVLGDGLGEDGPCKKSAVGLGERGEEPGTGEGLKEGEYSGLLLMGFGEEGGPGLPGAGTAVVVLMSSVGEGIGLLVVLCRGEGAGLVAFKSTEKVSSMLVVFGSGERES